MTPRTDLLAALSKNVYSAAHAMGNILLGDQHVAKVSCLFDSGALGACYISSQFVNDHYSTLSPYLFDISASVRLASDQRIVPISKAINLTVQFSDHSGALYPATLQFQSYHYWFTCHHEAFPSILL